MPGGSLRLLLCAISLDLCGVLSLRLCVQETTLNFFITRLAKWTNIHTNGTTLIGPIIIETLLIVYSRFASGFRLDICLGVNGARWAAPHALVTLRAKIEYPCMGIWLGFWDGHVCKNNADPLSGTFTS